MIIDLLKSGHCKFHLAFAACLLGAIETSAQFVSRNGSTVLQTISHKVGIGTDTPEEKLHIMGSVRGDQGGALRISTGYGWIDVGPRNAIYAHFYTDRAAFYFDRSMDVNGTISSYGATDLRLRTNSTERITVLNSNGYVGIGTTTPGEMLDVRGNIAIKADNAAFSIDDPLNARLGFVKKSGNYPVIASSNGNPIIFTQSNQNSISSNISTATYSDRMIIAANGYVGINTNSPQDRFHVSGGNLILENTKPYIYTGIGTNELNRYIFIANSPGTTSASGIKAGGILVSDTYDFADPSKNDLIVKGRVGIGTSMVSNPNSYTLAVNGKIGAKDIQIESKSWPDYVFDSDYKLPSLSEVEQYILKNKHLQDMPSAEEVSKNGYSVSEVDNAMLKKIEELTLYIIELQKQVDSLNAKLEKR